jgi:hypothetical protein
MRVDLSLIGAILFEKEIFRIPYFLRGSHETSSRHAMGNVFYGFRGGSCAENVRCGLGLEFSDGIKPGWMKIRTGNCQVIQGDMREKAGHCSFFTAVSGCLLIHHRANG